MQGAWHRESERSAQLVKQLLGTPASFDHGVDDARLIETHISWLLLLGKHAYKIKKPLALGFLDFSTLERRRAACEEELRINRRTAPDLYLDVVPITGTAEAPRVGGIAAEAIEWAVHMRRFAANALFSDLAARGELTSVQIDALARELAAFQAHAAVATASSPYGEPAASLRLALDNFDVIGDLPGGSIYTEELARLAAWTQATWTRLRPLMNERRRSGHVREGHGDLHLGNLLWQDDRARLFDAIEFDAGLRWLDTASDLAFVFMDLQAHGLTPLAWRFVNAWLEWSGDFGALTRLPFDAVYCAMVRAKVAALRAAESPDSAVRAKAGNDIARYLELAARLARPRRPWLAITMGVSGSGKSSQTQALIEQRGLARLRADALRKRLFGLTPEASSAGVPGGIYDEATSERLFTQLLDAARRLLLAGQPVLVDATFIRRRRRAPFIALAESLGLPWRILAFDAPEDVLRERVRRRRASGTDVSEADETVLAAQLQRRQPLRDDEAAHALHLDARTPIDWSTWAKALPPCRDD